MFPCRFFLITVVAIKMAAVLTIHRDHALHSMATKLYDRESISFVLELSILFIRSTELKKKLIATYTKLEQKGPTC